MTIYHILCFPYLAFKVLCAWFYGVRMKDTNQIFRTCTFALILNMTTCNSTYYKYKVLDINVNLLFFFIQSTQSIVSNISRASKSQFIEIQNPRKSPFNNMDLVWKKDVQHGRAHIIEVECAYILHAQVSKFLNGEQSHEDS
jgi:hypothetical protein